MLFDEDIDIVLCHSLMLLELAKVSFVSEQCGWSTVSFMHLLNSVGTRLVCMVVVLYLFYSINYEYFVKAFALGIGMFLVMFIGG